MRFVWGWMILGWLLSSVSADAKDDKKKKGKEDEGILMTGLPAFDSVFTRVGEIDRRLSASEGQLRSGKNNLNSALDLKRGTPISDGLAELRDRAEGKVSLAVDKQAMPKLKVDQAVPSNVQAAVDAVNAMSGNFATSLTELRALAPEIDGLVKESKKMPARLKDEFAADGGGVIDKLFTLPKVSKALTHDIGITTGLADRTTSLTSRMTDVLGVVQTEFGGRSSHPGGRTGADTGSGSGAGTPARDPTPSGKVPPVAKKPAPKN